MSNSIPDRWLHYKPIGKPIEGTRFIAFKVPLSEHVNENVRDKHKRLTVQKLLDSIPNLGLVIDLTYTYRYYNSITFTDKGVEHVKLMIPGRTIPKPSQMDLFTSHVKNFLKANKNNGKLIGVHCTHGVNRTGYFICYHMVTELKMKPDEAIRNFQLARGYKIERDIYLNEIHRLGAITHRKNNTDIKSCNKDLVWNPFDDTKSNLNYQQNRHSRNLNCKNSFNTYGNQGYINKIPSNGRNTKSWRNSNKNCTFSSSTTSGNWNCNSKTNTTSRIGFYKSNRNQISNFQSSSNKINDTELSWKNKRNPPYSRLKSTSNNYSDRNTNTDHSQLSNVKRSVMEEAYDDDYDNRSTRY